MQAWLDDKTEVAAGVTVTYKRGPLSASLTATSGDQQHMTAVRGQAQAATVTWSQRDYFILAADLVAAGFTMPPQAGDRITETIEGVATVFELRPGPNREPCWRWSGDRLMVRCHTERAVG